MNRSDVLVRGGAIVYLYMPTLWVGNLFGLIVYAMRGNALGALMYAVPVCLTTHMIVRAVWPTMVLGCAVLEAHRKECEERQER